MPKKKTLGPTNNRIKYKQKYRTNHTYKICSATQGTTTDLNGRKRNNLFWTEQATDNRTNELTKFDNNDYVTRRREIEVTVIICIFEKNWQKRKRSDKKKVTKINSGNNKNTKKNNKWPEESLIPQICVATWECFSLYNKAI